MFFDDRWEGLNLEWSSKVMVFYTAISVGYFVGDLIICLVQLEDYGVSFLFHATCGFGGLLWSMLTAQGNAYGESTRALKTLLSSIQTAAHARTHARTRLR